MRCAGNVWSVELYHLLEGIFYSLLDELHGFLAVAVNEEDINDTSCAERRNVQLNVIAAKRGIIKF